MFAKSPGAWQFFIPTNHQMLTPARHLCAFMKSLKEPEILWTPFVNHHIIKVIMKKKPTLFKKIASLFFGLIWITTQSAAFNPPEKTINNLPHLEDFSTAEIPGLPDGWTGLVKSTNANARIETTTIGDPVSPPNQARAMNVTDADATLFLITPEIAADLNQVRVRFFAKANSGTNNAVEVGTFDLEEESMTVAGSFDLTTQHTEYVVSFGDYAGDNTHIAFRAVPGATSRIIYFDNILIETIPDGPLAEVRPGSYDFGPNQFDITWPAVDFTVANVGVGPLTLTPEDIYITGPDAGDFALHNIGQTIVLEPFESTTIGVSFSAQSVGMKHAVLNAKEFEVPLTGEGFDATISSFPHNEDFNTTEVPDLPFGWTSRVESHNHAARVETTTLGEPVSAPNQLRFINMNDGNALLLFISPPIVTEINQLRVSFFARSWSGTNDAVEVGTYNHGPEGGFTPLALVPLTSNHVQYELDLNEYEGSDVHLAFRSVPEGPVRPVYFDNISIGLIPTEAQAEVSPDSWEFEPVHYGQASEEKTFIITNTGGSVLSIGPDDISIAGENAQDFVLNNLNQTVQLATNETTSIGVIFAPAQEGDKQASLMVTDLEVPLSGYAYNPNITTLPHYEDFSGTTPPDLPFGWTTFIQSTAARADIATSHLSEPNSPPYHVRFRNFEDAGAELILISPEIEFDLQGLRVAFWSKSNIAGNHTIEVGTWNPDHAETFTPLKSFSISTSYEHFFFDFSEYDGDAEHIAFRAVQAEAHRFIMLDDFLLDHTPDYPILEVTPESFTFEPLQTGTQSAPKAFLINNAGGDTLFLEPGQITISGPEAAAFQLTSIAEDVALLPGETTSISVVFSPQNTGEKTAVLTVDDFQVPLSGEGFDATVHQFPYLEDFSGVDAGEIPLGWIRETTNWGVTHTNHAGGQAPEMRFYFAPNLNDAIYLKSPLLNTSDFDEMMLSFRHRVNNYQTPGIYTLKVITMVDDQEHLIFEWNDPGNIPPESLSAILSAGEHGIGAENLRIAFVFDGATSDIDQWYIDDILLREVPDIYEVTFQVNEHSAEEAPMADVIINISGAGVLETDETGGASIQLEAGDYTAEILKPGYIQQSIDFSVNDDKVIFIKMQDVIMEPNDLQVSTTDLQPGQALFTWNQAQPHHEFRYDDGVLSQQIGFPQGNINSLLGAVHHYNAVIHEISWHLTDEGGPHHVVKVWVLGLDQNGLPDRNNILYEAENVNTIDFEWSTHIPAQPIEAPDGFFLALSYSGFLGLGVDDGEGEPWEFVPGTQFGIFNITDPSSNFTDIANWDFSNNFMLRAYGENLGTIEYKNHFAEKSANGPAPVFGRKPVTLPETSLAGPEVSKTGKSFSGFNIYLNDMEQPYAEGISGYEFLFDNLEGRHHTAGVQAVYTTGASEIVTIDFEVEGAPTTYSLSFDISAQDGTPIPDAIIELEGETFEAGEYVFENLLPGTYQYSVSREGYHQVSSQATIVDADKLVEISLQVDDVSVSLHDNQTLVIYPNPANQRFRIEASQMIEMVRVVDLLGQVWYFSMPNDYRVDVNVSDLSEGIYLVQVRTQKGTLTKRLQVTH
jgi:hypothetical protein